MKKINEKEKLVKEYLIQEKFQEIAKSSINLDIFFEKAIKDYLDRKLDDETFGLICEEIEAEPEHHYMKLKDFVYGGADFGFLLSTKKNKEIEKLKNTLKKLTLIPQ